MLILNKKRIFLFLLFLSLCLICNLPHSSFATSTGVVLLSANQNNIEKGEEIEIAIHLENNKTAAFHSYLYFDDSKVEYVSGPENTNVVENRVIFVWYDETGGKGAKEGELAKFKFKAKEDGLANFIVQGEFYSAVGQLIQTDFKETQIRIGKEETKLEKEAKEEQGTNNQSNNATLQVLRIDKEGLVPNFEKDIYEYYLTIPNEISQLEVLAIPENPMAEIAVTGNTNLKQGPNEIKIQVLSEDKTQNNTYTIYVTKTADAQAANTNLETLAIENQLLNPPFDTNITHYTIEVPNEMTNLNILAIPENEKATVQIKGKSDLKEGNNKILVTVTATDKITKRVYEIEAYRRNQEEEKKYQEEQKANQEKLEEIYQTQKLSTEFTNEEENQNYEKQENPKTTPKSYRMEIVLGIVLVVLVLVIWRRKNKRQ